MRLSPVLVAIVAASTTLGLSNSAEGQTSESKPLNSSSTVSYAVKANPLLVKLALLEQSSGEPSETGIKNSLVKATEQKGIPSPAPSEHQKTFSPDSTLVPSLGLTTVEMTHTFALSEIGVHDHEHRQENPTARINPPSVDHQIPLAVEQNPVLTSSIPGNHDALITLHSDLIPVSESESPAPHENLVHEDGIAPELFTDSALSSDVSWELSHVAIEHQTETVGKSEIIAPVSAAIDIAQAEGAEDAQEIEVLPPETPDAEISPLTEPPPDLPTPSPTLEAEPEVLVAEVAVSGVTGELEDEVYRVIKTQPGRTSTRSQLQQDINAIFATGWFRNVRAVPEDTPLGVRVTFEVEANPVLKSVEIQGGEVLPPELIESSFGDQYGRTLNLQQFEEGVKKLNQWYQDNGYVLAQVTDAPQVLEDGTVRLQVAEGVIESIEVRYLNKDGEETDADGNPVQGKTRSYIITREVEQQPGDVFNREKAQQDLRRVFGLGIFEDVRLALEPGAQDPRKARVVVNVIEKSTGSLAAGAGVSSASGLFGTVSYQQQNLGGNNQRLGGEVQLGERTFLIDLSFTDPWIGGDRYRTSYTVNLFRRRTVSVVFGTEDENEIRLQNDDEEDAREEFENGEITEDEFDEILDDEDNDRPRVVRTGGGVTFTRPFSPDPFTRAEWTGSLGVQYQRVSIEDSDGEINPISEDGELLSFDESGKDDIFTLQFGVVRDRRNSALQPTQGSLLRLATEQSIPVGSGSIFFNRLRGSWNYYRPVSWTSFYKEGPQALAFSLQGGTVIGDLPPYEAFAVGGSNSVRGYGEGELGVGRSFIQGTVEYRFPIASFLGGVFFVDAGTTLGSQSAVPGEPGEQRDLPGSGVGGGLGVRIQSPVGPIRIDYAVNNEGDSRLHFGIGERF